MASSFFTLAERVARCVAAGVSWNTDLSLLLPLGFMAFANTSGWVACAIGWTLHVFAWRLGSASFLWIWCRVLLWSFISLVTHTLASGLQTF